MKRTAKPEMVIVVDRREQLPLDFGPVPTILATLDAGDYTACGLRCDVVIERKSIADLVGTLTHGRDRFVRECDRLAALTFAAIVVEGTPADVEYECGDRKASSWSIFASTYAIAADYRIPTIWAGDRAGAARATRWILERWWRRVVLTPTAEAAA